MKIALDYNEKSSKCQITMSDVTAFTAMRKIFSTPNKGKNFASKYAQKWIPSYFYFITPTGLFHFGLAEIIIQWIRESYSENEIEWKLSDSFKKRFSKEENPKFRNELAIKLRDYQEECVKKALYYKFGTFVLGTGGGKTLVIASILDNLFYFYGIKRALILVPDNGLVLQFNDELTNNYKINQKITLFYDKFNKLSDDDEIVIANRPLFLTRWYENEEFWRTKFDCLIVDEAHSLKRANEVSKCIEKISCTYKFGFTGTLAPEKEDKYKTLGLLGPVRYEKASKELRDEGYLTNVQARCIRLHYPPHKFIWNYRKEVEALEVSELRNDFLTKLVFKLQKNTLLLVNHIDHGMLLKRYFDEHNLYNSKQIYFIRGEVETEVREKIKKDMEQSDNIICIAITKIFSTGINIKNLHNIILCAGEKSSITVIQSIGRGLRLHPDKKELNIFDISDAGYKYSVNHADERQKIYAKEQIEVKEYDIHVG